MTGRKELYIGTYAFLNVIQSINEHSSDLLMGSWSLDLRSFRGKVANTKTFKIKRNVT